MTHNGAEPLRHGGRQEHDDQTDRFARGRDRAIGVRGFSEPDHHGLRRNHSDRRRTTVTDLHTRTGCDWHRGDRHCRTGVDDGHRVDNAPSFDTAAALTTTHQSPGAAARFGCVRHRQRWPDLSRRAPRPAVPPASRQR
jgi:hypothetical protein